MNACICAINSVVMPVHLDRQQMLVFETLLADVDSGSALLVLFLSYRVSLSGKLFRKCLLTV